MREVTLLKQMELRNEEEFRSYLSDRLDNLRVISDCISRCRRVQKSEGDLAGYFANDRGRSLLALLEYSLEEANAGISPKHSIIIKGSKGFKSLYEGTQSFKNAVKSYYEFMSQKVRG
jgi:hypothetical protein